MLLEHNHKPNQQVRRLVEIHRDFKMLSPRGLQLIVLLAVSLGTVIACQPNECANQLLSYLNGVHQDLNYANRTIRIERLSERMGERLSDIESDLDQYSRARKESRDSLNRSIEHLLRDHESAIEHFDLDGAVSRMLDALEKDQSKLLAQLNRTERDDLVDCELSNLMFKMNSLQRQHKNLMTDLELAKENLQELSSDESADVPELIERSQLVLDDQMRDSAVINSTLERMRKPARQLVDLSSQFRELSRDSAQRAENLVTARILGPRDFVAQVEMRQSIESLKSKLKRARLIISLI